MSDSEYLIATAMRFSSSNPKRDISFELGYDANKRLALFLKGKVEGRSLKMPVDSWRYSDKNNGTIVGPSLPVYYEKALKYKSKK